MIGTDNVDVSSLVLRDIFEDVGAHIRHSAVARQWNARNRVVFHQIEEGSTHCPATVFEYLLRESWAWLVGVNLRLRVCQFILSLY